MEVYNLKNYYFCMHNIFGTTLSGTVANQYIVLQRKIKHEIKAEIS